LLKKIAFIPHKQRLEAHRLDYIKAINSALDYPWQAEDGRDLSPIHAKLANICSSFSHIPYWNFTNCCTDSLQIAYQLLTKPNDLIGVPAYGWVAITNAPEYVNRRVSFIDVESNGNISKRTVLEWLATLNEEPAAINVVHNFGDIVNVKEIREILPKSIKIIEDAAPAFVMREPVTYYPGSAADIVCYSFDFTKNPGTLGSGGGIATINPEIHEQIQSYLAHGYRGNNIFLNGTKSCLDTTSAAVLTTELSIQIIRNYRGRRQEIAETYKTLIGYTCKQPNNLLWERYTIHAIDPEKLLIKLENNGIMAKSMFKQPLTSRYNIELPGVKDFVNSAVHIPLHHYLTNEEIKHIIETLS